jgi:hypothetical protein
MRTPSITVRHTLFALALCAANAGAQAPAFEVTKYELELYVEPETKLVRGTARVDVRAGAEALERATFSLNDILTLSTMQRDGASVAFERGERVAEGRAIVVALAPPLAPRASTQLTFTYEGKGLDPDEQGSDWMGVLLVRDDEVRMSHQAQWYPIVPRDERARSKLAAPVELVLDLPAGMESLGPGELEGVKKAKKRERHHWSSSRAVQPSILAGSFSARTVKHRKLAVRVLAFPGHEEGAKGWADDALQSLEVLSKALGKLDVATYGLGEMRVRNRSKSYNYEADGFAVYDGVLFDGRAPEARKIAHEVAHLWFGAAADPSGPGERFLTEGLAELAAWWAVEARFGEEAGIEAAQAGLERYFGSPGDEHALVDTDFSSPRYSQVAYAKGAFAVRTLQAWIGAEAVADALRAYVADARDRGGATTLEHFLAALRERDAEAVDAWTVDWLRRPGAPSYSVELTGERAGRLVQSGELYRNPVELELHLVGGRTHTLVVRPGALASAWTADVGPAIESVTIDPRAYVLFERSP